jgi:hypothetical protein
MSNQQQRGKECPKKTRKEKVRPGKRPRLRPFFKKDGSFVVGWHDGERVTINFADSNDPVIAHHEAWHERIFTSMPDGYILRGLLMVVAKKEQLSIEIPPNVETNVDTFVAETRFAQEVSATYLGIKQLSPQQISDELKKLNKEYRKYYDTLAEAIDPHFHSTYMQYIVGTGIVWYAFSSPFLTRFVESGLNVDFTLKLHESPNERIHILIATLKKNNCAELFDLIHSKVKAYCEESGHEMWDLHSEEDWKKNPGFASLAEAIATDATTQWLQEKSALELIDSDARGKAIEKLSEILLPYGIQTVSKFTSDLPVQAVENRRWIEAGVQAESMMDNPKAAQLVKNDDFLLGKDFFMRSFKAFSVISDMSIKHTDGWTILTRKEPDDIYPTDGARVSTKTMLLWLQRYRDFERAGFILPEPLTITIGLNDIEELVELNGQIFEGMTIRDLTGKLYNSMCWYWRANWLELLENYIDYDKVKVKVMTLIPSEMTGSSEEQILPAHKDIKSGGVWVKVLKFAETPGIVMRVYNYRAAAFIKLREDELIKEGKLTGFDEQERRQATRVVSHTLTTMAALWKKF